MLSYCTVLCQAGGCPLAAGRVPKGREGVRPGWRRQLLAYKQPATPSVRAMSLCITTTTQASNVPVCGQA